jgi:ankyrin repeat protein
MQPTAIERIRIDQAILVPTIKEYLESTQYPNLKILDNGICRSLVMLRGVSKFDQNRSDLFQKIQKISSEKIQGISTTPSLQKLCRQVVDLKDQKKYPDYAPAETMNELLDTDQLRSSFHLAGMFPYNSQSNKHDHLAKLLKVVVSIAPKVEKFILLSTGDHLLSITVNSSENTYEYYDPNNPDVPPTVPYHSESDESFNPVAEDLLYYSQKLSLPLAMNLITDEDISKDISESKELKELREEILKSNPNDKTTTGFTPCMLAMINHFFDDAEELVANGGDPNLFHSNQRPPMIEAAFAGDLAVLEQLQHLKADINTNKWLNKTPLWIASIKGQLEVVKYLLSQKANPNIKDESGKTPLERVRYIIENREEATKFEKKLTDDKGFQDYCGIAKILEEAMASTSL